MIFQKMKGIDLAFKHIKLFTVVVLTALVFLCGFAIYKSFSLVSEMKAKVYVLVNGKALEAYAADRKDNIPVEAKDHIRTFHQLFFTLSPDERAIKSNLSRSFYLADASAKREYDNLSEQNYYSSVIASNVSQTIKVDSISLDLEQSPFYFKCYATQVISRSTSIVTRSLITEGYLSEVSRSDNNSHGFLIQRWQILSNQDIQVQTRE